VRAAEYYMSLVGVKMLLDMSFEDHAHPAGQ
jgi:hypothetical protein